MRIAGHEIYARQPNLFAQKWLNWWSRQSREKVNGEKVWTPTNISILSPSWADSLLICRVFVDSMLHAPALFCLQATHCSQTAKGIFRLAVVTWDYMQTFSMIIRAIWAEHTEILAYKWKRIYKLGEVYIRYAAYFTRTHTPLFLENPMDAISAYQTKLQSDGKDTNGSGLVLLFINKSIPNIR